LKTQYHITAVIIIKGDLFKK